MIEWAWPWLVGTAAITVMSSVLGLVLPPILALLGGLVAGGLSFWTGLKAATAVKTRVER